MTRDEFLTEKIGLPWTNHYVMSAYNPNFSTWEGFGKLWEWTIKQEWWILFLTQGYKHYRMQYDYFSIDYIHPDRFADAVAHYLGFEEGK